MGKNDNTSLIEALQELTKRLMDVERLLTGLVQTPVENLFSDPASYTFYSKWWDEVEAGVQKLELQLHSLDFQKFSNRMTQITSNYNEFDGKMKKMRDSWITEKAQGSTGVSE